MAAKKQVTTALCTLSQLEKETHVLDGQGLLPRQARRLAAEAHKEGTIARLPNSSAAPDPTTIVRRLDAALRSFRAAKAERVVATQAMEESVATAKSFAEANPAAHCSRSDDFFWH